MPNPSIHTTPHHTRTLPLPLPCRPPCRPLPGREKLWDTWLTEMEKLCARKPFDMRGVCDLMAALARVPPGTGGRSFHPAFMAAVLRSTRMQSLRWGAWRGVARHVGCERGRWGWGWFRRMHV